MSKLFILFLLSFVALADVSSQPATRTTGDAPRPGASAPGYRAPSVVNAVNFIAVDVMIDPHGKPLACYQAQIVASAGDATLVGVAGGDAAAFNDAPYYDPRALQGSRIILGAYSLATGLPTGPTHVATLMLRVNGSGAPHLDASLIVAGSSDGKSIPADVILVAHPQTHGGDR